jgi:predicted DNA-binding transcriptional regulator YafY
MSVEKESVVIIRYTNYRGETADRRIIPIRIRFGSTKWHPEPQWLLEAFDVDRGADRAFALSDVLHWKSESNSCSAVQHQKAASEHSF